MLEKDQPCIRLYYPVDLYLINPDLQGLFVNAGLDLWYFGMAGAFTRSRERREGADASIGARAFLS